MATLHLKGYDTNLSWAIDKFNINSNANGEAYIRYQKASLNEGDYWQTGIRAGTHSFIFRYQGNDLVTIGASGTISGTSATFSDNVGIGTASPSEKLSVNGKIRAKEIKVETSGWSDFVFEPSYKLPDLMQTEQFIKDNKHLPEIPSAAEVEKSGINLGEMNAKLLQKIEELTLYLIESKKEVKDLQERMKVLEVKQ